MLTFNEINVMGDLLNTTWGKHSTEDGNYPVGTASPLTITGKLVPPGGDGTSEDENCKLVINYIDIITFRSDVDVQIEQKIKQNIAERAVAARLIELKKQFKEKAGRTIKLKEVSRHDSVQAFYSPTPAISLIGMPARRPEIYKGYYRYTCTYSVV